MRPNPMAWADITLRHHDMPSEEIRAILEADGPEIVRRYLELHGERLEEKVAEQRRTLACRERFLADAIERRNGKPETSSDRPVRSHHSRKPFAGRPGRGFESHPYPERSLLPATR